MKKKEISSDVSGGTKIYQDIIGIENIVSEYSRAGTRYYRFQTQFNSLKVKYDRIRKVQGDGDCFYRSVALGCLETIFNERYTYDQRVINMTYFIKLLTYYTDHIGEIRGSNGKKLKDRPNEYTRVIQDIDIIIWFIISVMSSRVASPPYGWQKDFKNNINSLIYIIRAIGLSHYRKFKNTINLSIESDKISSFEETLYTMGTEADFLQETVVSNGLNLEIRIISINPDHDISKEYILPGLLDGNLNPLKEVAILHRPGHFDLLYKKNST